MLHITYFVNETIGCFRIVDVTPSDFKIDRISTRIGGHVDLSRRASMGSLNAQSSTSRAPFTFW
jgi:hypothetical protein